MSLRHLGAAAAVAVLLAAAPAWAAPAKHASVHHAPSCAAAWRQAEHALKTSKGDPSAIAAAWQHMEAARQARMNHDAATCRSESMAATHMLTGMRT